MHIIKHRINTLAELTCLDTIYGAEVDIRTHNGQLIISHDPLASGELFSDWIKHYRHGTLILNVKEEGLESHLRYLMKAHKIDDFFFLDQSIPFLIKTAKSGESRCAVRFSQFESIETVAKLARFIDWVWIDCFTVFPFSQNAIYKLQSLGLKTCLVSPELQGRFEISLIAEAKREMVNLSFLPTAVCTKRPELWL